MNEGKEAKKSVTTEVACDVVAQELCVTFAIAVETGGQFCYYAGSTGPSVVWMRCYRESQSRRIGC